MVVLFPQAAKEELPIRVDPAFSRRTPSLEKAPFSIDESIYDFSREDLFDDSLTYSYLSSPGGLDITH